MEVLGVVVRCDSNEMNRECHGGHLVGILHQQSTGGNREEVGRTEDNNTDAEQNYDGGHCVPPEPWCFNRFLAHLGIVAIAFTIQLDIAFKVLWVRIFHTETAHTEARVEIEQHVQKPEEDRDYVNGTDCPDACRVDEGKVWTQIPFL